MKKFNKPEFTKLRDYNKFILKNKKYTDLFGVKQKTLRSILENATHYRELDIDVETDLASFDRNPRAYTFLNIIRNANKRAQDPYQFIATMRKIIEGETGSQLKYTYQDEARLKRELAANNLDLAGSQFFKAPFQEIERGVNQLNFANQFPLNKISRRRSGPDLNALNTNDEIIEESKPWKSLSSINEQDFKATSEDFKKLNQVAKRKKWASRAKVGALGAAGVGAVAAGGTYYLRKSRRHRTASSPLE